MELSVEEHYALHLTIDNVRKLQSVIEYALQVWPGSPARPPEEQEFLWSMREATQRCTLDHAFHNS